MSRAQPPTPALLLLLVLAAGFLAMAPALGGTFLNWDDDVYVYANPMIADLSPSGIGAMVTTLHAGHWFPLTLLSYAVDYRIAGLDPRAYHRTNLLLHLAATATVFLFVRLLTGNAATGLLCSLLFAVHPAHAESVAWIAERKDTLYAPLFLGSLAAWIGWIDRRGRWLYLLSLSLFAASLAAKSMAMTLPLVLLLIDRYRGRPFDRRGLLSKVPFLLLALGSALLTLEARGRYLSELRERAFALADLPTAAYRILLVHLGEIIVPAHLFPVLPGRVAAWPAWLPPAAALEGASAAILLVLVPVVIVAGWRRRPWAFGALFFLLTILPVARITAPGYFADRYTYVTSVGVFLVVVPAAQRLWRAAAPGVRPLLGLCLAAVLLVLPLECRARAGRWAEGIPLWTEATRLYPGVPDAWFLRGEILSARGEHRLAVADLDTAERLGYRLGNLYEVRAASLSALGETAAAARDQATALRLRGGGDPPR